MAKVDRRAIRAKFGDDYVADEITYTMGIDQRFTEDIAKRFAGRRVLESCTGGGFATIALAREAAHVITIEIEPSHQAQARQNVKKAGVLDQVTFVCGDVLDGNILEGYPPIDAAFLDPDWAVTGPEHVYRFRQSNTKPPADALLEMALGLTPDVTIVLPPLLDTRELDGLPAHECQKMYLDGSHELYCLCFGSLARSYLVTELRR
jgi:SAM-dependent methyltransferase